MDLRKSCVALGLVIAAPLGLAAETSYDFTVCNVGRSIPLVANGDIVAFGIEGWGVVSSSTTKFWENASTHCVGYMKIITGKRTGKGSCFWVEAGGDTAVGEWEYPAAGEPTWVWLSGTGKLKGISGGGTFKDVVSAKPSSPDVGLGCRRDWGKFNLP